ncbi:unnamed protein product [Trifolium pratense]|uniref:Uncharacterized protein n=1 Tax=Trifolium pratense TaxID=57577 RepID=A0ACB0LDI0_TRIPR|nr:unnamed protein product [Trifolium pratense]
MGNTSKDADRGNVPPRLVHLPGRKRRLRILRRSGHGKLQLLLYDYGAPHIARCIYDNKDRDMITPVSNETKMNSIVYFVNDFKWVARNHGHHRNVWLKLTGYLFLDPALLSTFVERWHGETSSFHMPSREMTITLDDVCCLVHLPIKGRLLDHKGIPTKTEGVELMIKHMGSTREEAEHEVHTYAWGTAALAFLYRELTNATIPSCKYVAGYMTLLQAWIYDYFLDNGGSLDTQYEQQYHRDVCPFEDITLYSGCISCGPIKVSRATILSDTAPGYMSWYFRISHPYIVYIPMSLMQQPMPVESDAAMLGRLASIREILNGVMHIDEVPNNSRVYNELQSAYTLTFVLNQGEPSSSSQH